MNTEIENSLIGKSYLRTSAKAWKNYFSEPIFIIEFILTIVLLFSILASFVYFINYIETRPGVKITDPLLETFNPVELSGLIFGIIYISIITAVISLLDDPTRLLFAFQVYILLLAIRMLTLYLVPFDPPADMIPLIDPLVEYFGTEQVLTRDLFFSGHTATLFLLFLVVKNKTIKAVFLTGCSILAIAILLQHVHYTIDVIAAPFFAYTSYRVILVIGKRFKY